MAAAVRRGRTSPGGDTAAAARRRALTGLTRVIRLLAVVALLGCALLVVALLGGGVAAARDQASAPPPAARTTLDVLRGALDLERGGVARARTDPATLQAVARLSGAAVATGGGPDDAALGLLPDGRGGPVPPGQPGDATRPRWEHGLSRVWAAVAGAPGEAGEDRGGSPEGGSPGAGRLAGAGLTLAQAAARPTPGPYGTVDGIVDRVAGQAGALAARVAEFAADHANLLAASELSRRAERLAASVRAHAGDARASAKREDLDAARANVDAAIGDLEQLIRLVADDVTPVVRDRAGELFDQEAGLAGLGVEDLRQQIGSYGRHARRDGVDVAAVAAAAAGVARQLADATTRAAADHREPDVWWPAADVWWAAADARYHAWSAALSQTWPMRWIMSPARTHALRAVDALETAATLAQVSAYRWGREGGQLELAAESAGLMLDAARRGAGGLGRGAGLEPGATTTADAARDEGASAVVVDPAAGATAERALTSVSVLAQPAGDKPALGDLGDRVASQATVLAEMTTRLAGGYVVTDPQDRDPHGVAASVGAHVDAARTHERRGELSLARASLDRAIGDLEILSYLAAWVAGVLDVAGEGLHSVAEGASGGVEVNRLAFDSYETFADRPPKSADRVAGTLVADARTLVGWTRRSAGGRGDAELTELTEEVEARAADVERYGTFPWRWSPWRLFASPAAVREAAHRAIHAYDRLTVYADSLAYRLKREASGLDAAGGSARALAGEARRRADERVRGAGLDAPEATTAAAPAGGGEDGDAAADPAAGRAAETAGVPGGGPEPAAGAVLAAADPLTADGHAGPGDGERGDGEAGDVAGGFAGTPGDALASTVTEGTGSGTGSPMPDGDGLPAADASIDAGDTGFTGSLFG